MGDRVKSPLTRMVISAGSNIKMKDRMYYSLADLYSIHFSQGLAAVCNDGRVEGFIKEKRRHVRRLRNLSKTIIAQFI